MFWAMSLDAALNISYHFQLLGVIALFMGTHRLSIRSKYRNILIAKNLSFVIKVLF